MKNEFHVKILFGIDQTQKFYNNEPLSSEEISQFTKSYSFDTEIELNSFILGIEEANGWLDLVYSIKSNSDYIIEEIESL